MVRTIEYADVTGSEWRSAACPELVQQLGQLGFRVLGRVAQRSGGGADTQFDREQRARLHDWRTRPAATLLVSTDGESYVCVDRYGDAPVLRFRTAFPDGTLVETVAITTDGMLRPRPGLDPFETFTFGDAPGRAVTLVKDLPVADVARTHRERVGVATGTLAPRRHAELTDAVDLWNAAARHTLETSRSVRRWRLVVGIGWLLVAVLPGLVVARAVGSAPGVLLGLLASATALALLVPPIRATARALGRARWWRPPYPG